MRRTAACRVQSITCREGEDPAAKWWQHIRAALGEGCCPQCGCRLEPVPTGLGVGGACRHCDKAWASTAAQTDEWRLTDPHDGSPMPLTPMRY